MKLLIIVFLSVQLLVTSVFAEEPCDNVLQPQAAASASRQRLKSYSVIASVMVGSSSLAALLSSLVGENSPALTYFAATFLSQLSSLGVYVVGAPIWEPLQSKVRAMAYRKTGEHQEANEIHSFLEKQYFRTNRQLTINEQMSRNILRDYVLMVSMAFDSARHASSTRDFDRVARQIAEVAVRLNKLYPDVDPKDPLVVRAIHIAFTDFIELPSDFSELVLKYTKIGRAHV